MQKSEVSSKTAHRKVQSSTTLSRRYVKKPVKNASIVPVTIRTKQKSPDKVMVAKSSQISRFGNSESHAQALTASQKIVIEDQTIEEYAMHPMHSIANQKMQKRNAMMSDATTVRRTMSAKELKDQAIRKALAEAQATVDNSAGSRETSKTAKSKGQKLSFGFGRVMLALSCAAVAVMAIVYFVNLNMPDISLKVAAMQTGINASYPSYVPRDYSISSITSEDAKITLDFKNTSTDSAFSLIEESSSWDSNTLMTNYVKDAFGDNYNIVREQGLTIYISGSNAAWVNGGIVYKIIARDGVLTNKQIRSIATSL